MPDDARVLFGLAPVHTATLTGHAEIAQVFTVQAEVNRELRQLAATTARVDVWPSQPWTDRPERLAASRPTEKITQQ